MSRSVGSLGRREGDVKRERVEQDTKHLLRLVELHNKAM